MFSFWIKQVKRISYLFVTLLLKKFLIHKGTNNLESTIDYVFPHLKGDPRETHTLKELALSQPSLISVLLANAISMIVYHIPIFFRNPATVYSITSISLVMAFIKVAFNIKGFGHYLNY